jgi:hypothetical protein
MPELAQMYERFKEDETEEAAIGRFKRVQTPYGKCCHAGRDCDGRRCFLEVSHFQFHLLLHLGLFSLEATKCSIRTILLKPGLVV